MNGASACWPPSTSAPDRARPRRAPRCWRDDRRARLPGTRWTVAGEVPGRGRPPPVDRALRHVRDGPRRRCRRVRLGEPVARAVRRPGGTRPTRCSPPTPTGWPTATRSWPGSRRSSPGTLPSTGSSSRRGRRAVREGPPRWTTFTPGTRCSRRLLLTVEHATRGERLPGSPIRFDDNPFSGGWGRAPPAADARPARRRDPGVAGLVSRDWHAWHEKYDDPTSSLSRRLAVAVRARPRCSGGGRAGEARQPLRGTAATPCRCWPTRRPRWTRCSSSSTRARGAGAGDRGRARPRPGRGAHRGRRHDRHVRGRLPGGRAARVRRLRQRARRRRRRDGRCAAVAAHARGARRLDPRPAGPARPDRGWTATRAWSSATSSPPPASNRSPRPPRRRRVPGRRAPLAGATGTPRPGHRLFSFV